VTVHLFLLPHTHFLATTLQIPPDNRSPVIL
jgi:hypothetical protein